MNAVGIPAAGRENNSTCTTRARLPEQRALVYFYVRVIIARLLWSGIPREVLMLRKVTLALVACLALPSMGLAAEPIEGTWKRSSGTLIKYAGSGGKFCGTVMNGEYKGKSIGCMNGSGANYKGQVNKLDEGKTYKGTATVNGNKMTLSGCVLFICKDETLTRQ